MQKITERNLKVFQEQYSFDKSNYNIIVSGINGSGKYQFVEYIIKDYFKKNSIHCPTDILSHPDVYYVSLPLYDKSGKQQKIISNNERLLYEFGFEEKIEGNRVGSEITVDQIRALSEFTSMTSTHKHKIIIINNCKFLNKGATAALLKTLEETNSNSIFFLLTSDKRHLEDTILSRCHNFNYLIDDENFEGETFYDYYMSLVPRINEVVADTDYMADFSKIENELKLMFEKKINPMELSESWRLRGGILIDYLLTFFAILLKGRYLAQGCPIQKLYQSLYDNISLSPERAVKISRFLLECKKELDTNINKKFFFDNLLIVLNKNLY